jgi:hypothetical protein
MLYVYLAAMDAQLHALGTQHPAIGVKLAGYESALRELLAVARTAYDEVGLHVFSDHGMTNITSHCDLQACIAAAGLRFGQDYVAVYDSTMARFWFLAADAQRRIEQALAGEPRGRVLDEATLCAWGCAFPGQRYGELFFLLDPGVLLLPSFMGEVALAGMHGYDPQHASSWAMYAANEQRQSPPGGLADLYRLMCGELPEGAPR